MPDTQTLTGLSPTTETLTGLSPDDMPGKLLFSASTLFSSSTLFSDEGLASMVADTKTLTAL